MMSGGRNSAIVSPRYVDLWHSASIKIVEARTTRHGHFLHFIPFHISSSRSIALDIVDVSSTSIHSYSFLETPLHSPVSTFQLRRILFRQSIESNHSHQRTNHEYQPSQPPRPSVQRQEAKDGARAGRGRHPHPGGDVSFFRCFVSPPRICSVGSRQEILTSIIPFVLSQFHSHSPFSNSDLDYVNLTTHADVSSEGLSCCCHLRLCVLHHWSFVARTFGRIVRPQLHPGNCSLGPSS